MTEDEAGACSVTWCSFRAAWLIAPGVLDRRVCGRHLPFILGAVLDAVAHVVVTKA